MHSAGHGAGDTTQAVFLRMGWRKGRYGSS